MKALKLPGRHPSVQTILLAGFGVSLCFDSVNLAGDESAVSAGKLTGALYLLSLLLKPSFLNWHQLRLPIFGVLIYLSCVALSSFIYATASSPQMMPTTLFLNSLLFIGMVGHFARDPRAVDIGLRALALGCVSLSLFYRLGWQVDTSEDKRDTIFGDNENVLGVRMAVGILVLANIIISTGRRRLLLRSVALVAITPCLALLAGTGSRVAVLSLLGGMSVLGIGVAKRGSLFQRAILASGVFVFLAYVSKMLINNDVLASRLIAMIDERNTSGREEIWLMYLENIRPGINLVLGRGVTGFWEDSSVLFGAVKSPHNSVLEAFLLGGALGLGGFLLACFSSMWNAFKQLASGRSPLPLALWVPYFGTLATGQVFEQKLMWLILAIGCSGVYSMRSNEQTLAVDALEHSDESLECRQNGSKSF